MLRNLWSVEHLIVFQIAVIHQHEEVVNILLEKGALTDVKTPKQETLLHLACNSTEAELGIVEAILDLPGGTFQDLGPFCVRVFTL